MRGSARDEEVEVFMAAIVSDAHAAAIDENASLYMKRAIGLAVRLAILLACKRPAISGRFAQLARDIRFVQLRREHLDQPVRIGTQERALAQAHARRARFE